MTKLGLVLERGYTAALRAYLLDGDEAALDAAYDAGRRALEDGSGILELLVAHHAVLAQALAEAEHPNGLIDRAGAFLAEALSSHEITRRGYEEANAALAAVNEELHRQVAERERAERAARAAEREAERANHAKSEFLSRMSHELRTPLNAIIGFAQLLELHSDVPEVTGHTAHILKAGEHLLALISEVLDIARIESGQLALAPEAIAAAAVIAESAELVGPQAEARGVELRLDLPDEGVRVHADRQRLKQVLVNLLSNAVKYNRRGGTVTVSWAVTDGGFRIDVSDTGPGIDPDLRQRLFRPFDRLGAEHTDEEGTGLGLALSKHLVEAMGGQLALDSRLGVGSTFSVELSLAAGRLAAAGA